MTLGLAKEPGTDCVLVNDAPPCCKELYKQATAPTCGNKYGIDESDTINWPFLIHWSAIASVTCDMSKGWYRRGNSDGNICGNEALKNEENMWSACQENDMACCWRKTCAPNEDYSNGHYNGAEGLTEDSFATIDCGDDYALKDNPQYIVCEGDCHADCCDKIPDAPTCLSERVACSHGFERRSDWESNKCGDNCVENSGDCCESNI